MSWLRDTGISVFFLWMFVDAVFVFRHATGAAENRDRYSLRLILLGSFVALWISIGLAFGTHGAMGSAIVQVAGLVTMAIGIAVRTTAIVQLGRFHTPNVAVRADHQLMQTGLYKRVRHPSYLGALIAYFGLGLALGNWLSLAVIGCVTPCIYLIRMHEEDAALLAAFGEPYRAYCQRTRRLIPWLY